MDEHEQPYLFDSTLPGPDAISLPTQNCLLTN